MVQRGRLSEYEAKRDFTSTPEPTGRSTRGGAHTYVFHKHDASRLHWDLRLELDGVLVSWAVPKGPPSKPGERRLAVKVEDHPLAYGSFEGVIPEGQYGAGTVETWDTGTWRATKPDPQQALADGHLEFELQGKRLTGRWVLIRTGGRSHADEDSWLLIKEKPDPARADPEPASDPAPNPSDVPGAVRASFPKTMDVELCTLVDRPPTGDEWFHEIKFDGYRIVAFVDHGTARLVSRTGQDWTQRFAVVARALASLPVREAVFDGELVIQRKDGRQDFGALQNYRSARDPGDLRYMVFDLTHLDGYDLRDCRLDARKSLLAGVLAVAQGNVRYTDHLVGSGATFFDQCCAMGLEGSIAKRADAQYRATRSRDWLKIKCLQEQEFVIVGYTDPQRTREHFGALALATHIDGVLTYVGRVGTGFTGKSLADLDARLEPLHRESSPLTSALPIREMHGLHWVDPVLVAEVAYTEMTSQGHLRHPTFRGLREDKNAREVVLERPVADPPEGPAGDAVDTPAPRPVEKRVTRPSAHPPLTHPDRVLWPDQGITKAALVSYLTSVASVMLPHVGNRPLSLVRCPDGVAGECFFHKHVENFPEPVTSVPITERKGTFDYAVVTDAAGLAGLAQMNVVEIHPWGSRADRPDRPDRIIFDLDPDPNLAWEAVTGTALLMRSELERLDLQAWVKSTGGKGVHVVVPIVRRYPWQQVHDLAQAFARHIVDLDPRLFTLTLAKEKRHGQIYIDYLRNNRGATAIGAYSPRVRAEASVSVPLTWDELAAQTTRRVFSLPDVVQRVAKQGSDPWHDLPGTRQSLVKALAKLG